MITPCTETERITRMEVKLDNVEKGIEEVKDLHKEMSSDLKEFYQTVDSKYATKDELKNEITRLEKSKDFLSDNWFQIITVLFFAAMGLAYINDKVH